MNYTSTMESLSQHQVPEWFHDAKLGIFIHWGLFSMPAYAVTRAGSITETLRKGIRFHCRNNPYAEWYLNSLRLPGSSTYQYHAKTYGAGFSYDDFIPAFNKAAARWKPGEWASLFKKTGAQYVVLVTKHHDGFTLWPSAVPNPNKNKYHASRDIVGELTGAVTAHKMKMGLYYSGGLDWTFTKKPWKDYASYLTERASGKTYVDYANRQVRELIDTYRPSIIWNDICYPPATDLRELFAYYYNAIPDGVINDRWAQQSAINKLYKDLIVKPNPVSRFIANAIADLVVKFASESVVTPKWPKKFHCDYITPEYVSLKTSVPYKWEATRGIGNSFGYNQFETAEHYASIDSLIRMLVDIVSKNGNLLLNVGPSADGSIPDLQKERLLGLGAWLAINGEAIFGTRPWGCAEGKTECGVDIRFTEKGDILYAHLLERPKQREIAVRSLAISSNAKIQLLGAKNDLEWRNTGKGVSITLPAKFDAAAVYVIKIMN